jgi:hypothetical protein
MAVAASAATIHRAGRRGPLPLPAYRCHEDAITTVFIARLPKSRHPGLTSTATPAQANRNVIRPPARPPKLASGQHITAGGRHRCSVTFGVELPSGRGHRHRRDGYGRPRRASLEDAALQEPHPRRRERSQSHPGQADHTVKKPDLEADGRLGGNGQMIVDKGRTKRRRGTNPTVSTTARSAWIERPRPDSTRGPIYGTKRSRSSTA